MNALAEPKYIKLATSGNDLVNELYMDPRIVKYSERDSLNFPNINKAVDEICVLFNIDVMEKRLELLNMWLLEEEEHSNNVKR